VTPQLVQQLLPYALSFATPHVAAILNDPRPHRAWLRILIVVVLILSGTALQLWASGSWSWVAFVQAAGALMVGTGAVWQLLKDAWLGKMQSAYNGIGGLIDLGRRGGGGGTSDAEQRIRNLKNLQAAGLITQEKLDEQLDKILGDV
jgi:hypothetical protein